MLEIPFKKNRYITVRLNTSVKMTNNHLVNNKKTTQSEFECKRKKNDKMTKLKLYKYSTIR
jgi:hypothetical protein